MPSHRVSTKRLRDLVYWDLQELWQQLLDETHQRSDLQNAPDQIISLRVQNVISDGTKLSSDSFFVIVQNVAFGTRSVWRKTQTALTHGVCREGREQLLCVCVSVTVCAIQTATELTDKDILTKTYILNTLHPVAYQAVLFHHKPKSVCNQGDALYPLIFFLN